MRLSQMPTDEAMDALCEIIPAAGNICNDPKISSLLKDLAGRKKEEFKSFSQRVMFMTETADRFLPLILKDHRQDVYAILSALNERPVEAIKAQPVVVTIKELKEAWTDPELLALFHSQGQTGDAKSSGSASESTEEN